MMSQDLKEDGSDVISQSNFFKGLKAEFSNVIIPKVNMHCRDYSIACLVSVTFFVISE